MEPKKVLGIVISAAPINEYDKRVVLLTKEMGKISAFARNARRTHNNLMGATIPFTFGEFTIIERSSAINIISADSRDHFSTLHESLESACYGMYLLELADYFTREYNDESEMLKLLYQSLRALASSRFKMEFVKTVYEWKTLVINGTYPDVTNEEFRSWFTLSKSAEYALQFIINTPIAKLYTFNVDDNVLDEMIKVVNTYLNKYVDRKMNSLSMLDNMFDNSNQ